MRFFYPNWKYFHNFSIYLQPELWFTATEDPAIRPDRPPDDAPKTVFRVGIGVRVNVF
jgi:hypothetical protein